MNWIWFAEQVIPSVWKQRKEEVEKHAASSTCKIKVGD